jgi:hypothetical protein
MHSQRRARSTQEADFEDVVAWRNYLALVNLQYLG